MCSARPARRGLSETSYVASALSQGTTRGPGSAARGPLPRWTQSPTRALPGLSSTDWEYRTAQSRAKGVSRRSAAGRRVSGLPRGTPGRVASVGAGSLPRRYRVTAFRTRVTGAATSETIPHQPCHRVRADMCRTRAMPQSRHRRPSPPQEAHEEEEALMAPDRHVHRGDRPAHRAAGDGGRGLAGGGVRDDGVRVGAGCRGRSGLRARVGIRVRGPVPLRLRRGRRARVRVVRDGTGGGRGGRGPDGGGSPGTGRAPVCAPGEARTPGRFPSRVPRAPRGLRGLCVRSGT
ncbi:hypothetical protein GA0115251_114259 [Streptomyces sp. TverLS-915]|nr:hypothetical protein GA0115251_114259 [Streptomyces sp. TverLS-915]